MDKYIFFMNTWVIGLLLTFFKDNNFCGQILFSFLILFSNKTQEKFFKKFQLLFTIFFHISFHQGNSMEQGDMSLGKWP